MDKEAKQMTQDIPKLYTAFSEWLSCMILIAAHGRRFMEGSRVRKVLVSAAGLLALIVIQSLCGMVSNALWLVGMAGAVAVMIFMTGYTLKLRLGMAVYTAARAFMRAELAAAFEWQIDRYYVPPRMQNSILYSTAVMLLIYSFLFFISFRIERYYAKGEEECTFTDVQTKQVILVWVSAAAFFALSNLSYVDPSTPFSGTDLPQVFRIRTLVGLAGVFMLELFHVQKVETDRRREAEAIRNVLNTQYMQYRESQENIDMLNRKYHDLKHQLEILRSETDDKKRTEYYDELEKGIRFYETEHKTGNSVLDTILTSKSRTCRKLNIEMKVIADGKLLDRIHVMDIASIFGNALDNAIEHEAQIPDPELRMIRVSVHSRDSMTCISIENYFQGVLKTEGGEIRTTKADNGYHGYGLKSIRYTAEKYGGFVTARVEDGWFRLQILLP